MRKKIRWYGVIPKSAWSWLSFVVQDGKGYEYNAKERPTKIIVTSDDNDGKIPDDIHLKVEKNGEPNERTATVTFHQDGGKKIPFTVKQDIGHVKIKTGDLNKLKEYVDERMEIIPKTAACNYNDTTFSFTAKFTYKEVYDHYELGCFADNPLELYEDFVATITSDTFVKSSQDDFTWSSDNGSTISGGVLTFPTNTDKENDKTYNVSVSYKIENQDFVSKVASDNAVLTQGADSRYANYTLRTNLKGATVTFRQNGEVLSSVTASNSNDGSLYPYIAVCNAMIGNAVSVDVNGSENEVKTYSINVTPNTWETWNTNKNKTLNGIVVNSTCTTSKNDFSQNSHTYGDGEFNAVIVIPRKETVDDAAYKATLPNGVTFANTQGDYTALEVSGDVEDESDIVYYVVDSPSTTAKITLYYMIDYNILDQENCVTLVYDYGILGKTVDEKPNLLLYRKVGYFSGNQNSFDMDTKIKEIYLVTNKFKLIGINPKKDTYIDYNSNNNFYLLKIGDNRNLVVNGNKVIVLVKFDLDTLGVNNTIPKQFEYKNGDITAIRIPSPFDVLDDASFYCNINVQTVILGESVNTLVSDCLAGLRTVKEIYIGHSSAPSLYKGDNKGFTFRAAAYDEETTCNVQSEGCTIYGVQKAESSYKENATDRWKWPGCIREEIASTYKANETADEDCLKKMDANIKTWIINTSSYNPRNEFDKLLKLVKPKANI